MTISETAVKTHATDTAPFYTATGTALYARIYNDHLGKEVSEAGVMSAAQKTFVGVAGFGECAELERFISEYIRAGGLRHAGVSLHQKPRHALSPETQQFLLRFAGQLEEMYYHLPGSKRMEVSGKTFHEPVFTKVKYELISATFFCRAMAGPDHVLAALDTLSKPYSGAMRDAMGRERFISEDEKKQILTLLREMASLLEMSDTALDLYLARDNVPEDIQKSLLIARVRAGGSMAMKHYVKRAHMVRNFLGGEVSDFAMPVFAAAIKTHTDAIRAIRRQIVSMDEIGSSVCSMIQEWNEKNSACCQARYELCADFGPETRGSGKVSVIVDGLSAEDGHRRQEIIRTMVMMHAKQWGQYAPVIVLQFSHESEPSWST